MSRTIKQTTELFNEDGSYAARCTMEFYNLNPSQVAFLEDILIIRPYTELNDIAKQQNEEIAWNHKPT